MAQAKRRRRRKHRGTPAGTIERAGRTGRPQTRQEAREIARRRRQERLDRPPSWRSVATRAAIAALLLGVLVVAFFGRPLASGAFLAAFMFLIYVPLGYAVDLAIYRLRKRRRRAAAGGSGTRQG